MEARASKESSATMEEAGAVIRTQLTPLISSVLDYLSHQEVASIPDLRTIASYMNISPSHFCHIFKAQTGVPFTRYVKSVRMRHARKLLQETCMTVKQVMFEVGISDHSHFSKDYKREFGENPTETRRNAASGKKRAQLWPPNSNSSHQEKVAFLVRSSSVNRRRGGFKWERVW
jgi:AraC-like DNA-binding protein